MLITSFLEFVKFKEYYLELQMKASQGNIGTIEWTADSQMTASGSFTLWNAQFHELYSPFKAHTMYKSH